MADKYIVILADGQRLLGRVKEFPDKAGYVLYDACFAKNTMVKTPQGLGIEMALSMPDGDYRVPTRVVWRPARPDEIEMYREIVAEYKKGQSPIHQPAGTPTSGGIHYPPGHRSGG